jgi:hypothetical protein
MEKGRIEPGKPVCIAHRVIFAYGVQAVWSIFPRFAEPFERPLHAFVRFVTSVRSVTRVILAAP